MDTNSLQSAKKRSFHLPRFRRSSVGERQKPAEEIAKTAEEVAHVQKAAAWQWYTRGVGEAVVPTKRPPVRNSQADDKNAVNCRSEGGQSIFIVGNSTQQKKTAESPRAASRFKVEASFTQPTSSGAPPTPSAPSGGPSTPLFDDVELSGLRTQMADFVQHLQSQHRTKDNEQFPAVGDHQKSKPPPCPSAPAVSIDHQKTKAPPVAAASSSDHLLTTLPLTSAAAPVASRNPLHMRPFSSLHRFIHKVVSGPIAKSTSSPTAVYEPEVFIPEDQNDDTTQCTHYHHYIHHHHHHYHGYAQSPEERATVIRSQHRHSESSGIHPHIPQLWEAESDEEADDAEESPIKAYRARRRRHSSGSLIPGHLQPKKADFDEDEGMKEESVKATLPTQFVRRYSSERFSPNKISTMVNREIGQPAVGRVDGSFHEYFASRRMRHSAEYYWEVASLERTTEGGGKSAKGAYKLGQAAGGGMQATPGGRKNACGAYKLGAAVGGGTQATPVVGRRHSEGLRRPGAAQYEMAGKCSPSASYYVDALERHISIPAPANATPTHHAGLPPLYPQIKPPSLVYN